MHGIGVARRHLAVAERHDSIDISNREQRAAQREFFGAPAVGEKAVVTDAMEPVRQRVQQEAPDKFVGRHGHDLVLVVMSVVAPAEADPAAGERHEPAVGDRDAVCVAAEIGQYCGGAREGPAGESIACMVTTSITLAAFHAGDARCVRGPS